MLSHLKRRLLGNVFRKEEEGSNPNGRGGANSDGKGGISDGKGNKDPGGRDGDSKDGGGGEGGGGKSNGGDKQSSANTSSDTDNQDATQADAPTVDAPGWAEQTQRNAVAQMARSGLSVTTDDTGAVVSAEPERAANFGLFGANDYGVGTVRARTAADMATYGIDIDSLNATDRINAIDPSRTISPDMQRAAMAGLGVAAGPVGAIAGASIGGAIDAAVTASRLGDLGFTSTQAKAIADSAVANRTAQRTMGIAGGMVAGPLTGALAGALTSNPVHELVANMGLGTAAKYGIGLAADTLADKFSRGVYDNVMSGRTAFDSQPDIDGGGSDRLAETGLNTKPSTAASGPVADIDMGSDFYSYLSEFGGDQYGG